MCAQLLNSPWNLRANWNVMEFFVNMGENRAVRPIDAA